MHLGDVIKNYRAEHGKMSMQAFADKCGLSKGYIAMLERNINSKTGEPVVPSIETFIKVASAMSITLEELTNVVDENQPISLIHKEIESIPDDDCLREKTSKGISIPILNTVVAGMPIDAYEDILGYEEISRELASTGEFFALKIKGDSMLPVLQENDIIIVRQQSDVESGDIAIVLINGDSATVKKVMKQESGITLIAFNPAVYEPHFYSNDEIESLPVTIAGKVVEMKRSF